MTDIEEAIRKIVREEMDKRLGTDAGHFFAPQFPPKVASHKCHTCGIDFGNGPMAYVCQHPHCPTRISSRMG